MAVRGQKPEFSPPTFRLRGAPEHRFGATAADLSPLTANFGPAVALGKFRASLSRVTMISTILNDELLERVLAALGFSHRPERSPAGLRAVYAAWCQKIPFDNVRKLIHLRAGKEAPFPGGVAEDFFEGWLKYGTGGTCWAGAGACHALLSTLGFDGAMPSNGRGGGRIHAWGIAAITRVSDAQGSPQSRERCRPRKRSRTNRKVR